MESCLILEIPPFLLVNFLKAFIFKGITLTYVENLVIQRTFFSSCASQLIILCFKVLLDHYFKSDVNVYNSIWGIMCHKYLNKIISELRIFLYFVLRAWDQPVNSYIRRQLTKSRPGGAVIDWGTELEGDIIDYKDFP